jgi:tRNA (adenine57-N1/adenine58-N1)-methyltransferase
MNAPFAYGEKVLLLDLKQRRYLITLAEGAEFHSHNGFFAHSDLVGQMEGVVVKSTKGSPYTALRPTLEDFVVEMPRGAQVIYPKDLAPICMLGDIAPGVRVLESGVGSGALSMMMAGWGAEIGFIARRSRQPRRRSFLGEAAMERHAELRDSTRTDERDIDRAVLDLPSRWSSRDGGAARRVSSSPARRRSTRASQRERDSPRRRERHENARGVAPVRRKVAVRPDIAWSPTPVLTTARFLA